MIKDFEQKFLDFARAKPADEAYLPGDFTSCALAQFVQSQGFEPHATEYCPPGKWQGWQNNNWPLYPSKVYDAAMEGPHTWLDLVQRLEAVS